MLSKLRERIQKDAFQPTWLGLLVNPVFIVRNELYKAIKERAKKIQGNVLDFGCGAKPYANLFVHAESYIGCDIEVSGHDHKDSQIDCFFNGQTLPFKSECFDAVVSFEVFEHVFDLSGILGEIYRVTKPRGLLLISVPFVWGEHEAPYDFARYTTFGLKHVLKESGYEVLELNKNGNYILMVAQLFIVYLSQNLLPKGGVGHVLRLFIVFPLNLMAYFLSFVLPKRNDLFCGSVVLAKKI